LTRAEAPPGHAPLHVMARHALWDAWVHERDIMLPLGLAPVEEADEVQICLQYIAGAGPAFLIGGGSSRSGTLAVLGTDPEARVVVEVGETVTVGTGEVPAGAVTLEGPTLELLEALSLRRPLPHPVAEEGRWLLAGLATAFESPVPG
jgi:hypothetical protein